jgi:EAL domain-containing protein (putative c-di-GMP-specific phosphodiesterase class I)
MPLEYSVDEDKFLERMDSELTGWVDPVARLREALVKNEFELYCQPIQKLSGEPRYPLGEVLVRLREEERALLPPGEFLPVFEHYGMLPQLDRWVVFHVAQRLGRGTGLPRLAVNVSAPTLQDGEFLAYVAAAKKKYAVPDAALLFEIDESDVLARLQAAAHFANAAKALGCGVLIDGFGRRSASFAPLKVLRADFVKVDGSVVRRLAASEAARTKLSAIVRVAETLRMGVVAECVEDTEVLAALRQLNVGHAQGFGIHKPKPIDSF